MLNAVRRLGYYLAEGYPHAPEWCPPETGNQQVSDIPVIYIWDDIVRMYQHSKRAAEDLVHSPRSLSTVTGWLAMRRILRMNMLLLAQTLQ